MNAGTNPCGISANNLLHCKLVFAITRRTLKPCAVLIGIATTRLTLKAIAIFKSSVVSFC